MTAAEIEVAGLWRAFGRRQVLRDISFTVPHGAFLALFGPAGAGKTTLLRVLATLLSPHAGDVRVAGHDVAEDPLPARRAIGYIAHEPLLFLDLTARQNLRFYADMYGVPGGRTRVDELLERLQLTRRGDDVVRTLSRGTRQRLAIARALLHRPRVLLLDEPYEGLDLRAVDAFDGLLAELRGEHTFVMVTHSLAEGLAWSDRQLVLVDGRVARRSDGSPAPADFAAEYRELLGGAGFGRGGSAEAQPVGAASLRAQGGVS